jgi:predicted acylesterase/phospholipase RssA
MMKIGLILSGGASLGTYTAGAVTELLAALGRNRNREPVQVGVLAGASAGALTAAVAARALVVDPNLLPWIGKAWIEGMDASLLLRSSRATRTSLLDADVLDEISRALVTADPAADDEPSPLLADTLGLGLTLSNLHGVEYELLQGYLNRSEQSFGTRMFDDWISFELDRDDAAGAAVWDEIRRAAVASASFPFAFPPRRLDRRGSDYAGSVLAELGDIGMWYTDGGLFNNEPVRLAKRLVVRSGQEDDDWRFIFVDPSLQAGPVGEPSAIPEAGPRSAVDVAGLLSRAFLGQGSSKDWIRANRTNERLVILDSIVEWLPEIADSLTDPDAFELGRTVGELAEGVCERRLACGGRGSAGRATEAGGADPVLELLEESLDRIERRYPDVLSQVGTRAARSRLSKLIFLIEAAGGLDDKEPLPLYLVAPPDRLAGDFLGNFGGIFRREWREADFRAGRRDARDLIESGLHDVISYEPDPDAAYAVPELDASMAALSSAQRGRLEELVESVVDRAVGELDAGFLAGVFGFAWKPALRRWATRRALETLESAT